MKRARVYIRKSHYKPGEESVSPEMQLALAHEWCAKNEVELDEEASLRCADLNISGWTYSWAEREGCLKHFEDADQYDILLVFKLDRFGRDQADSLYGLKQFARKGVDVRSLTEDVDPTTDQGFIMRSVATMVAEMESRNTSRRVTESVVKRARNGQHHGGRAPNWLRRVGKGRFEVIDPIADAVRRLVGLRLQGNGYVTIARILNDEGFRTQSGRLWHRSMVVKYLMPHWIESMAGTAFTRRPGRFKTDRHSNKRSSRGEPIRLPGVYPRIIDVETERAILALQIASKPSSYDSLVQGRAGRYSSKGTYLLSGLCYCMECGGKMLGHKRFDKARGRWRHSYYCYEADLLTEGIPHRKKIVDAHLLEEAVLRALAPSVFETVAQQARALTTTTLRPRRSLEEIQMEIDRLMDLVAKNILSDEDFERRYNQLNAERERLKAAAIEVAEEDLPSIAESLAPLLPRSEQRAILRRLVKRVEYPVFFDHVRNTTKGKPLDTLKPCVRIWLRTVKGGECPVICPVYRAKFQGQRAWWIEWQVTSQFSEARAEEPVKFGDHLESYEVASSL